MCSSDLSPVLFLLLFFFSHLYSFLLFFISFRFFLFVSSFFNLSPGGLVVVAAVGGGWL